MKAQELKSLVKVIIKEVMSVEGIDESKFFGYDPSEPKSDSPVGPLNDLAGKVANNIRTGQIELKDAIRFLNRKVQSANDLNYVKHRIAKHLKVNPDTYQTIDESTEPSIGGSYSDQQTSVDAHNVRPERDPLTDPMLKEYSDPQSRIKAIKASAYSRQNPNKFLQDQYRGAKLIYQWVKNGTIDFKEFMDLIALYQSVSDTL